MAKKPKLNFEGRVRAHEFLWTVHKDQYVLLRVGADKNALLIIHLPTGGETLMIHDDEVARAVKDKMREAKVPVVTEDELSRLLHAAGH